MGVNVFTTHSYTCDRCLKAEDFSNATAAWGKGWRTIGAIGDDNKSFGVKYLFCPACILDLQSFVQNGKSTKTGSFVGHENGEKVEFKGKAC